MVYHGDVAIDLPKMEDKMTETLDLILKVISINPYALGILFFTLFCMFLLRERKPVKKEHVFCKDCTYFVPHPSHMDGRLKYATCSKFPQNLKDYLVSGDISHKACRYCSIMRDNENRCGVNGKYFEKKEETK